MAPRFHMFRHTIVAPAVKVDGRASDYPAAIRAALLAAGHDGWTEYPTVGYWRGRAEPGQTFEILAEHGRGPLARYRAGRFADHLAAIGRAVMADQSAVQVTTTRAAETVREG